MLLLLGWSEAKIGLTIHKLTLIGDICVETLVLFQNNGLMIESFFDGYMAFIDLAIIGDGLLNVHLYEGISE